MTALLYAVMPAHGAPDAGTGLEDRPLRSITRGRLRAVLSDHDAAPAPEVENLWAYEEAVERLMESGPLLPARFGTTADADAEIEAMLDDRHDELIRTLAHVGGAVELAIRPAPAETAETAEAPAPPQTGTEYMRDRLAQERQTEQLERATAAFVRARTRRANSARAYLVERRHVSEFVAQASALGLTITGPWPPYSFVGGEAAAS